MSDTRHDDTRGPQPQPEMDKGLGMDKGREMVEDARLTHRGAHVTQYGLIAVGVAERLEFAKD